MADRDPDRPHRGQPTMRAAVHVKSSHAAPGPMPCVTVEDGAAALACPPDYIAVPLLVFARAVMGNRWQIVLKPGFRRLPTLFAAIVGLTGAAKSPALGFVRHPVDVLQAGRRHGSTPRPSPTRRRSPAGNSSAKSRLRWRRGRMRRSLSTTSRRTRQPRRSRRCRARAPASRSSPTSWWARSPASMPIARGVGVIDKRGSACGHTRR